MNYPFTSWLPLIRPFTFIHLLRLILLVLCSGSLAAQSIDATFNPTDLGFGSGGGADSQVSSVVVQADSKILIGGGFTTYNGTARNYIARLNADGSLDTGFITGLGLNGIVNSIAVQPDGKILIGGSFTTYNGTSRNRIARLNANGSLDTGFNPGTGAGSYVYSVALQADGKILIGGDFTSYNGTGRNRIARLNNLFISASLTGSTTLCQNDANAMLTFTGVNGTAPYTFFYTVNNGTQQSVSSGTAATATVTQSTSVAGNFAYQLVSVSDASNLTSTVSSQTATVTITTLPSVALSTTAVCFGSPLTLSATSGLSNYTFTSTSGLIGTGGANTTTVTGLAAGNHSFTVTAQNASGCSNTATTSATVSNAPTRLYVKANASGINNGLDWANAFTDLQSALNYTCSGNLTEIWVASGTYKTTTTTDRTISFAMKNGVAIYGGFTGVSSETVLSNRPVINFSSPSSSTLSGDIGTLNVSTDNSYHVISNPSGLTTTAILDGFVITGGNANGSSTNGQGGAMYNSNSSPTITNCTFQSNSASSGGAIYNAGSSPQLFNCILQSNSATSGGAINSVGNTSASRAKLTNCSLNNNSASTGGALYNGSGGSPTLTNCTLINNSASTGGATYNSNSSTTLNNCIVFGNGGNTTFAFSSGAAVTGNYSLFEPSSIITNVNVSSTGNITNAIVSPFISANSNQLIACSSAINAGDPSTTTATVGTTDLVGSARIFNNTRIDMGAYEYQADPVSITAQPASGSAVCAGGNVTASVSVSGTGPFTYQWYKGNFSTPVTSQTAVTLSLTNVTTADAGSYSVVVTGTCSTTSSGFSLTVNALPTLALSTTNVCFGSPLTLSATAGLSSYTFTSATELIGTGTTNITTIPGLVAGPYMFSVTAQGSNGCSNTATVSTTVNAAPARLYVKANATGANTGLDWDNAFTDLQSALRYTCSGNLTEIWVTRGSYKPTTYTGPASRTVSFSMKNGVAIYGGFIGTETALSGPNGRTLTYPLSTTLSGDIDNDNVLDNENSYHVIRNGSGLTSSALLDGFLVTGGNANGSYPDYFGGGAYNNGTNSGTCSPTFRNCSFIYNLAQFGGALCNDGGSSGNSQPELTNCSFQGNLATGAGGAIYNNGYTGTSIPRLTNCSFLSNSASSGGAIYSTGIGTNATSSPRLTNCSFLSNSATSGGAIYGSGSSGGISNLQLTNSAFWNNGINNTFINSGNASVTLIYSLYEPLSVTTGVNVSGPGNLTTTTSPFASATSVALNPCSPAINAGDNSATGLAGITTDLAGNPRIFGSRVDMGAVEFQADPVGITAQPASGSAVCVGGTITAGVSVSGTGPFTYQWYKGNSSTPVASQTAATLSLTNVTAADQGSYSVVVSGVCSATSTVFSLTVNPLPTLTLSTTNICAGSVLTLSATSGLSNYTFTSTSAVIGTGATNTTTVSGLAADTHSFTVTAQDSNGCSNTATVNATVNALPTPTLSSATICMGATVSLTATGGNSYTLSPGNLINSDGAFSVSPTHITTYTVAVANASGCVASTTATVTVNSLPNPTLTASDSGTLNCTITQITLTATGGTNYQLSDGQSGTEGIFMVSGPGTYTVTVTVTDDNGCSAPVTTHVYQDITPPTASLTTSNTLITCANTSAILTASGGATYRWDDNSTDPSRTVYNGNSYQVDVIGANGCTSTTSIIIDEDRTPPSVTIQVLSGLGSNQIITCANPSLTLSAEVTPYSLANTFAWNTPGSETQSQLVVQRGGTFMVSVTAANGCTASSDGVIIYEDLDPPTNPQITSDLVNNQLTCSNPQAILTASGGIGYLWDDNASTSPTRTVQEATTYSVVITGMNGCTTTASITLAQDKIPPMASIDAPEQVLTCHQPTITLTANGGGYTYRWADGSTNPVLAVTTADLYSVTVTGSNGCTATESVEITADQTAPELSLSASTTLLTCTTPSAVLSTSLATADADATYLWEDNSTDPTRTVSTAGTYSVTVTSANGCSAVASTTVESDMAAPTVSLASSNSLNCVVSSATLTATASGIGALTYVFSGGDLSGTPSSGSTFTINTPATYTVLVTAANGCTVAATTTVQLLPKVPT